MQQLQAARAQQAQSKGPSPLNLNFKGWYITRWNKICTRVPKSRESFLAAIGWRLRTKWIKLHWETRSFTLARFIVFGFLLKRDDEWIDWTEMKTRKITAISDRNTLATEFKENLWQNKIAYNTNWIIIILMIR